MKKLSSVLVLIFAATIFLAIGCDVTVDDNEDGTDYTIAYYRDVDGDGYGTPSSYVRAMSQPDGYINNSLDCDDADSAINPDALTDIDVNGIDENCDGVDGS